MDLVEIGKGILCIIGAIIYFKYFNTPLFTKRYEQQLREDNFSENVINFISWRDKLRDIVGLVAIILFLIGGLLFIYNELAQYFGWMLLFVDM